MTKNKTVKEFSVGITPLGDRVLVKEIPKEDKKTLSGIIIPENVKDDKGARKGTVVAKGPGRYEDGKLIPVNLAVGENVLFGWGEEITVNGQEYFMVREGEVLAVIN